jgi:hypothetical protein
MKQVPPIGRSRVGPRGPADRAHLATVQFFVPLVLDRRVDGVLVVPRVWNSNLPFVTHPVVVDEGP